MDQNEYNEKTDAIAKIEDVDEQASEAKKLYEQLTYGWDIRIVAADWKEHNELIQDASKALNAMGGGFVQYFPEFYGFRHGEVDTIVAVVSKSQVSHEFAEQLVNLTLNLGA